MSKVVTQKKTSKNTSLRLKRNENLGEYKKKINLLTKFISQNRAKASSVYSWATKEWVSDLNKKGFNLKFNYIKDISAYCNLLKSKERPKEGYLRLVGRIILLKNLFLQAKRLVNMYYSNPNIIKNSSSYRNKLNKIYSYLNRMDAMREVLL